MSKEILILVKDAKYYQEQSSLIIVGVEVETRKPITQQITVKTFLETTGLFSTEEIVKIIGDTDHCRLLANQLKNRRHPFRLVFEGTQSDQDLREFFDKELAKG